MSWWKMKIWRQNPGTAKQHDTRWSIYTPTALDMITISSSAQQSTRCKKQNAPSVSYTSARSTSGHRWWTRPCGASGWGCWTSASSTAGTPSSSPSPPSSSPQTRRSLSSRPATSKDHDTHIDVRVELRGVEQVKLAVFNCKLHNILYLSLWPGLAAMSFTLQCLVLCYSWLSGMPLILMGVEQVIHVATFNCYFHYIKSC